jgi:hypothetical protein
VRQPQEPRRVPIDENTETISVTRSGALSKMPVVARRESFRRIHQGLVPRGARFLPD